MCNNDSIISQFSTWVFQSFREIEKHFISIFLFHFNVCYIFLFMLIDWFIDIEPNPIFFRTFHCNSMLVVQNRLFSFHKDSILKLFTRKFSNIINWNTVLSSLYSPKINSWKTSNYTAKLISEITCARFLSDHRRVAATRLDLRPKCVETNDFPGYQTQTVNTKICVTLCLANVKSLLNKRARSIADKMYFKIICTLYNKWRV